MCSREMSWTKTMRALCSAAVLLVLLAPGSYAQDSDRSKELAMTIARLYYAAFDHYPENPGFSFWVSALERGYPLSVIAAQFQQSQEFAQSYGTLTDRQFIEALYRQVLGRPGLESGIEYWLHRIEQGTPRSRVLLEFSQSRENILNTTPALSGVYFYDGKTQQVPPGDSYWLLSSLDRRDEDIHLDPVRVSSSLQFTAIAAGYYHSCAMATSGETYCWGQNKYDQLGAAVTGKECGVFACSATPVRVGGGHGFTQLVAGRRHSCGLTASGAAFCWWFGGSGQLGDGRGESSRVPVEVAGGLNFTQLAANAASGATCGLTAAGEAWCWGSNRLGSLGIGTDSGPVLVPTPVLTDLKFISLSISDSTACGVSTDGDAYCWGDNGHGQLGVGSAGVDGGLPGSNTPVAVQGGLKFLQVVTDGQHSCALQGSGALYCWGLISWIGWGASDYPKHWDVYHSLPLRAGLYVPMSGDTTAWTASSGSPWTAITAGQGQTCALAANGELDCWGQWIADPRHMGGFPALEPVRIGGDQVFTAFASGGLHDCAIGEDGFAYCWGSNNWAQVGRAPELAW